MQNAVTRAPQKISLEEAVEAYTLNGAYVMRQEQKVGSLEVGKRSGPQYARHLKRRHQGFGDTCYIDEVFVKIDGIQHYLWRAVDQDGEIGDVFLQPRRDGRAAKCFFTRLLKTHRNERRRIVTDKLRSYGVAQRDLIPDTIYDTSQYVNDRAGLSHQPTRVRERVMRRFKSTQQAQRFLTVHTAVYNLFNLGRHLVSAKNYRFFRLRAFASWNYAAAL